MHTNNRQPKSMDVLSENNVPFQRVFFLNKILSRDWSSIWVRKKPHLFWSNVVELLEDTWPEAALTGSDQTWSCAHAQPFPAFFLSIDVFIHKNMGAAIIDFRVCPPLVKCQNLMFSGFIDTLMYGFSSIGVTICCYFGLKFNDNTCCEVICKRRYNDNDLMTTNKLPGMYFSF